MRLQTLERLTHTLLATLCLSAAANASTPPSNLCLDSVALFQCDTASGKQIALCGSYDAAGELSGLQYRYGRGPQPELVYPAQLKDSLAKFKSNHYFRYQTDYSQISFTSGSYAYSVYSNYDGEGSPANPRTAGVTVVSQAGAPVADIACKAIRKDTLQALTGKVACDADQALGCSR
jgi:hypothetical protein